MGSARSAAPKKRHIMWRCREIVLVKRVGQGVGPLFRGTTRPADAMLHARTRAPGWSDDGHLVVAWRACHIRWMTSQMGAEVKPSVRRDTLEDLTDS